jgi:hypothetical protein
MFFAELFYELAGQIRPVLGTRQTLAYILDRIGGKTAASVSGTSPFVRI